MIMKTKRVFIRGAGIISSLGQNKEDFWLKLNSAHEDKAPYFSHFNSKDNGKSYYCGEVKDFSISDYYDEKLSRNLDRASEFASAVAKQALEDSRINLDKFEDSQKGVCLGISDSIATSMSDFDESVLVKGPRRCDIGIFPNTVMCAPASRIAIFEKIKGSNTTFSSGRNSGLDAIGFAFLQIMFEEKKIIIAGGAEALSSKILKGLENENLLFEVDQHKSFESKQGKFIPTEGASVVILCASDEGSQAYAEILAFNNSFAPYKKRDILARIKALSKNIQITLKDACLPPSSIDAIIISSHFDHVDREVETGAIANIFSKSTLKQTPVLGFKKGTGENFSAFGAMQVISAVGFFRNKFSRPSIDYFNLNPFFSTLKEFKHILIISLDSAGHNGSVVVSSP